MYLNLSDYHILQNTVQTKEIQAVLDEATAKGGAVVVVPAGTYITGTLNLGGASLYLEKGAVLKGSGNREDYYPNGFAHNEMHDCISLIYSMNHSDISISGHGVIDMNAEMFYDMDSPNIPDDGHIYSEEQKAECTRNYKYRPSQPIFFYNCRHISIKGIMLKNAPCWTMSFNSSEDIKISDITIENDMTIPNNDGMHFCSCKNVIIHGCNIAAGDDCIALSGITDWYRPCENITISDCIMTSVSKAISIGYIHSTVRNVTVSNCIIYGSQRGIAIMASKGTGLVEHVMFQNIRIDTKVHAGNWWGNGEPICLVGTYHNYDGYLYPAPNVNNAVNIRDISFHHISCTGENIIGVIGSGNNIDGVVFNEVYFERKDSANRYLKGDRCIDISPSDETITVPEDFSDCIYIRESKNVRMSNIYTR
ncbi:MAG TPA: glycoside hydrolase [Firmicutes bacterium]|nr:glycoside hydrolase [Bacillota bacterium]